MSLGLYTMPITAASTVQQPREFNSLDPSCALHWHPRLPGHWLLCCVTSPLALAGRSRKPAFQSLVFQGTRSPGCWLGAPAGGGRDWGKRMWLLFINPCLARGLSERCWRRQATKRAAPTHCGGSGGVQSTLCSASASWPHVSPSWPHRCL